MQCFQRESGRFIRIALMRKVFNQVCFLDQQTRTSLVIHEEDTGHTYAIYEPGQMVSNIEIDKLIRVFLELLDEAAMCLFCGSGQTPVIAGVFPRLIKIAQERGIFCILDSSGASLQRGLEARPFMVKVNQEELAEVSGFVLENVQEQVRAIQMLIKNGIRYVSLTLGQDGFLMRDGNQF